jgi:3-hydroxyacyl-CoA dehydrogenase
MKKEMKGHIANRIQAAVFREVLYLLDQDAASLADIDIAMAHGPGLRWAILGQFMNPNLAVETQESSISSSISDQRWKVGGRTLVASST